MKNMQVTKLHKEIDQLQQKHGSSKLASIYGAGCLQEPKAVFVFMNPTGRNISASIKWSGLRAPWLGTKNVWRLLYELRLLSDTNYKLTQALLPSEWTEHFSKTLYGELVKNKVYITNLAKCTQEDARPIPNKVFQQYLANTKKELSCLRPQKIISFGNQVSSILLDKSIMVSKYRSIQSENLQIEKVTYKVYPVYYPVGQGQRNMPLALKRLKAIFAM